jgi:phosphopantetheinyl transferase
MRDVILLHAARARTCDRDSERGLLERLPYAYRLELERRDAAARSASLQGLGLLAAGVLRLRREPLDFARLRVPDRGKPMLEGGPHFSIAHCASRVAIALREPHALGLDLEDLDAHGRSRHELEEWTAVEATLKVLGLGLRQSREVRLAPDLASAEIAGVAVHIRPVAMAPDCIATLATRAPVGRVVVEEIADGGDW